MPVNPQKQTPPAEKAATQARAAARWFEPLFPLTAAVVGVQVTDAGYVLPGLLLLALAGAWAVRRAR